MVDVLVRTRQVLDDCRLALEMLESERELRKWRVHWAGAMALLRAVGHIMETECEIDMQMREANKALFVKWKERGTEDDIFHEFIKRERDIILKEYEFNIHPSEEVCIAVSCRLRPIGGGREISTADVIPIGDNIYRPLLDSYREGDDARDVYSEAIEWWEKQIRKVEGWP